MRGIGRTFVMAWWATTAVLGLQAQTPPTVLRIAAGPHGAVVNGSYRLDEERARFDPARDKEVVVFFQWEGSAGPHRIGVQWRSPDGSSSTSSAIDYVARDRRFGSYWSLPLISSMPRGLWSVEATVDGHAAGRFSFELAPTETGGEVTTRRPLSEAEMYDRLRRVFVVLDRQSGSGPHLEPAAAVADGVQRMATAMSALHGADRITAILPDGSRLPVEALHAFHRKQDWAVIAGGPSEAQSPALAVASRVQVGERCFSMEGSTSGTRVLSVGAISGQLTTPAGERFIVQWNSGTAMTGAPVLNEYGEIIGVVGGSLVPGASSVGELLRFRVELKGVPLVPHHLLGATAPTSSVALADLRARGDVLTALVGAENVLTSGFSRKVSKAASVVSYADSHAEIAIGEKTFVAFINWSGRSRLKGSLTLRLLDEDNQMVAESKPKKIDLRPGAAVVTQWELTVPTRPGWYRADYLVDGKPVSRAFVKITG